MKKKEFTLSNFTRFINWYTKSVEYKQVINYKELYEAFDEYFIEDLMDCDSKCYLWQEMDERMDKRGYNVDENAMEYVRRRAYKKRPRKLKGQERLKL